MSYNSHYGGPAGQSNGLSNNGNRDRDRDNRDNRDRERDRANYYNHYAPGHKRYGQNYAEGQNSGGNYRRDGRDYYGFRNGYRNANGSGSGPNSNGVPRRRPQTDKYDLYQGSKYRPPSKKQEGFKPEGSSYKEGSYKEGNSYNTQEGYSDANYKQEGSSYSNQGSPAFNGPKSRSPQDHSSYQPSQTRKSSGYYEEPRLGESPHDFVDERRQNNRKQEYDVNMYQDKKQHLQRSQLPHQKDHYKPMQHDSDALKPERAVKGAASEKPKSEEPKLEERARPDEELKSEEKLRSEEKLESEEKAVTSDIPAISEDLANKDKMDMLFAKVEAKAEFDSKIEVMRATPPPESAPAESVPPKEQAGPDDSTRSPSLGPAPKSVSPAKSDSPAQTESSPIEPTTPPNEAKLESHKEPKASKKALESPNHKSPAPNEKLLHMFDDDEEKPSPKKADLTSKDTIPDSPAPTGVDSSMLSPVGSPASDAAFASELNTISENHQEHTFEERNVSDAETVVSRSPISTEKARKLLRRNDDERKRLKRKFIYSSDEEDDLPESTNLRQKLEDELNRPDKPAEVTETKGVLSQSNNDHMDMSAEHENLDDDNEDDDDDGDIDDNDESEEDDDNEQAYTNPRSDMLKGLSRTKTYKIKRDSTGKSLLQRACKKGDLREVQTLIARGADVNESDFGGFSCLHEAALDGHTDIVKCLIEGGADVNKRAIEAGDSETPLMDAAENKHLDTVKVLLENGADPHLCNVEGYSTLTKIIRLQEDDDEYDEILQLLVAATEDGKSSLKALSQSPRKVVEDPSESYFLDLVRKKNSMSTIYKYVAQGLREAAAEDFVTHGFSLQKRPDILNLAARNGQVELVDILLGLNPGSFDINQKNRIGVTALLATVGRGNYDVVKFLLSKGANPRICRDKDGMNALQVSKHSVHHDPREVFLLEQSIKGTLGKETGPVPPPKKVNSDKQKEVKSDNMKIDEPEHKVVHKKRKSIDETSEPKKHKKLKVKEPEMSKDKEHEGAKKEHHKEHASSSRKNSFKDLKEESPVIHDDPKPKQNNSASASPAPLTKAQEELKIKAAEEAKSWQEKVLAKKRARKEMFLQAEKEKERKRKEDEEKRIEELKLQEIKEKEQKLKEAQEAERLAQTVQLRRQAMEIELIFERYPIGLREAAFDGSITGQERLRYAPLYVFEIDNELWVIDLQIALIFASPVADIHEHCDKTQIHELDSDAKGKLWPFFFPMIGVSSSQKIESDGKEKFQALKLSYLKLSDIYAFAKQSSTEAFDLFWTQGRLTRVALKEIPLFVGLQSTTFSSEGEIPVGATQVADSGFVPPRWRRRQDVLRTIRSASTPLW